MEPDLGGLMKVLGLDEEPMGMFYTDEDPGEAFSPRLQQLPSVEMEKKGEVDWHSIFGNFSCVIGHIWRARKKKGMAARWSESFLTTGTWKTVQKKIARSQKAWGEATGKGT